MQSKLYQKLRLIYDTIDGIGIGALDARFPERDSNIKKVE